MSDLKVRCFDVEVVQINIFWFFVQNIVIKWFAQTCIKDTSVAAFSVLFRQEALLVIVIVLITMQFTTRVEVPLQLAIQ